MKEFKLLRGIIKENPITGLRWVDIEFDSYKFRIQTHHSSYLINLQMQFVNRAYLRMWDDGMNRDRILELLKERFADAINVISHDELVRNGW